MQSIQTSFENLRKDFPILQRMVRDNKTLVYLDNASTTQKPNQVIDAITDYKSFINLITESFSKGEGYLIGFYVSADEKNSAMNIGCLYQTGTSLPEKDYYTREDSSSKACRKALLTYAEKLFSLVGMNKENAVEQSNNLLLLETEIAKSHRGAVALRDPQSNYNKMSVKQLENLSPNLNWSNFFKELIIIILFFDLVYPKSS